MQRALSHFELILHSGEECAADTVCLHADVPVFVLKTKHPL